MLAVGSIFLSVNESNVDISCERRNSFPLPIVSNNLGNSPVAGRVPVQDGLSSSVSGLPSRSRTAVTAVPGLSEVAAAGGIGLPGAVHGAQRVNVPPSGAVKLTPGVKESLGAVAGDGGTRAGDLLVHPRVVFNAAGNVCPGAVILTQWNVVPTKITDYIARLTRE